MMKTWFRRVLVLVLCGFLAGALACGEGDGADNEAEENAEENGNEETNANQNTNNENQQGEIPSRCDEENTGNENQGAELDLTGITDYESNYDMILYEFAFTDESPGFQLNPIIDEFIEQDSNYPIIVLLELTEIDTTTGELMIRGGAGLHAGEPGGGEYIWDDELEEPDSAPGTVDGEGNLDATLDLLNFVATVETEEDTLKTVIPIRDLEVDAVLDAEADGSVPHIGDGNLNGIIVYDDVKDVKIALNPGSEGLSLVGVLDEERMNFDYSCDGEADSWAMSATFSAEETVIVD